jgi:hypothetical protein
MTIWRNDLVSDERDNFREFSAARAEAIGGMIRVRDPERDAAEDFPITPQAEMFADHVGIESLGRPVAPPLPQRLRPPEGSWRRRRRSRRLRTRPKLHR